MIESKEFSLAASTETICFRKRRFPWSYPTEIGFRLIGTGKRKAWFLRHGNGSMTSVSQDLALLLMANFIDGSAPKEVW